MLHQMRILLAQELRISFISYVRQFNLLLTQRHETEHETAVKITHSNLHAVIVMFKNIVQFALRHIKVLYVAVLLTNPNQVLSTTGQLQQ